MPTYAYTCADCATQLEVVQRMTDDSLVRCPSCGADGLRKVFQPVGVVFKGSGFYRTDSREKAKTNGSSKTNGSDSTKEKSTTSSDSSSGSTSDSGSSGSSSSSDSSSSGSSSSGSNGSTGSSTSNPSTAKAASS
ncbi:MAG: FmdB family transcriptional regulator [Streptosporangiales bacterium]|nr:FmdB family transcriptional regulator [Streptosporangiales bacterium]